MAEVRWIKLYTDIFNNRKIKQIEQLPEGDAILVIWLKLLALAGNVNDGGLVYITDNIPYTEQTLSSEFNKPIATVQLALETFKAFQMIEIVDNFLRISNWERYQNIEGMDKIRAQTRVRVQNFRNRQKQLPSNVTQCNVTVTQENRIDKNKNKNINNICRLPEEENNEITMETEMSVVDSTVEQHPCQDILDYLSKKANRQRGYKLNHSRKRTMKARFDEGYTEKDFYQVIDTKCSQWLNDKKMNQYLCPETLFAPSKFDKYLNEEPVKSEDHVIYSDKNNVQTTRDEVINLGIFRKNSIEDINKHLLALGFEKLTKEEYEERNNNK